MKPKETGFQPPYDPFQLLSWLSSLYLIFTFYLLIIPILKNSEQYAIGISFTIFEIISVFLAYKVTASNPTDPAVQEYRAAESDG